MSAPRILLVEDNPGDILLFRKAMTREGLDLPPLSVATDGAAALAFLQEHRALPPDLVVLDLNLPRIPGIEVLRRMRADPELSAIPVAILTSSAATHDVQTAHSLQANAYLLKPNSIRELQDLVRALCTHWADLTLLPPPLSAT